MMFLSSPTHRAARRRISAGVLLVLTLASVLTLRAEDGPRTFATPEDAVAALDAAVQMRDPETLRALFGPAALEFANPDRVQATNEFNAFAAAFAQSHRLARVSDTRQVLEVGADRWQFPLPVVRQQDGRWFFDATVGKDEILNRRIGKNELAVLDVMRTYVDAQREYASRDRTGNEVLKYAQRLASSPGKMDGLYWPPEIHGEESLLGPLVAEAQSVGYDVASKAGTAERAPFHGYFFKILTRQGKHAPGGKYNYIINGNMIGGFALVAWPAEYGESGVMTFIVNQLGRVYQRDLGPGTGKQAPAITTYDPDSNWAISPQ